jgi:hypothetical protein
MKFVQSVEMPGDTLGKVEQAKAAARKYVRDGWGSRSTVFHAIYDVFETDLSPEMCDRFCCILDPFHAVASAIYRNGEVYGLTICGALSGGLAGFSMVHGPKELPYKFWSEGMKPDGWLARIIDNPSISPEEKVRIYYDHCGQLKYGAYFEIVTRFKERFGTTDCFYLEKPYGDPISRECFKNCGEVIIWTAGMVAQVILDCERTPDSFEVGNRNVHLAVIRG